MYQTCVVVLTSLNSQCNDRTNPKDILRDVQQATALIFALIRPQALFAQFLDIVIGGGGYLDKEIRGDGDVDDEVEVKEEGVCGDEGLFAGACADEPKRIDTAVRSVFLDARIWDMFVATKKQSHSPKNRSNEQKGLHQASNDERSLLSSRHEVVSCSCHQSTITIKVQSASPTYDRRRRTHFSLQTTI